MNSPKDNAVVLVQEKQLATALPAKRAENLAAVSAALLGIVILFGAGFAPSIAHKQGHDARHTMGFVCH